MVEVTNFKIETPFGWLRGTKSEGVAAFRRVPYAQAPVGPRRFEMPGPAPQWSGVRDATLPGPIPPQLPSRLEVVNGVYQAEQSEDCLHLDIWTRHSVGDFAPVLVFIHGGAFVTGGGSLACYDGETLAKENGLVVVNITHRLGLLGFWPQPDFGGLNLGLHDQIAALRWIKEAISCFGGDPARITVAGQSAGALSISAMLGAGLERGLFNRAIMMSAPLGIRLRTVEKAKPFAGVLLEALGLGQHEIHRLRTMPVAQILNRLGNFQKRHAAVPGDITHPFMPVVDGELIVRDPIDALSDESVGSCDMVIGSTREEFAAFYVSNPRLDDMPVDELRRVFEIEVEGDADATLGQIRARRVPATPRTIMTDLRSDLTFVKPGLAVAAAQSKIGRNIFAYLFDWQSPNSALGACHCIDLPFLFGNIDVWKAAPMLSGADWKEVGELSGLFRRALAAFAENGNPNGTNLAEWPSYKCKQAVMHFDRRLSVSGWID